MRLLSRGGLVLSLAHDLTEVWRLRGLVFAKPPGEPRVGLALDKHPSTVHFLAYKEGLAVGCLSMTQTDLEMWQGVRIQLLAVDPQFQGQSVGSTLLGQAIADASARWPEKILWLSSTDSAKAFYLNHGFLPFIDTPKHLGKGETILIKS